MKGSICHVAALSPWLRIRSLQTTLEMNSGNIINTLTISQCIGTKIIKLCGSQKDANTFKNVYLSMTKNKVTSLDVLKAGETVACDSYRCQILRTPQILTGLHISWWGDTYGIQLSYIHAQISRHILLDSFIYVLQTLPALFNPVSFPCIIL